MSGDVVRVRVTQHAAERLAERCGLSWSAAEWRSALAPHIPRLASLKPRRGQYATLAPGVVARVQRNRDGVLAVVTVVDQNGAGTRAAAECSCKKSKS